MSDTTTSTTPEIITINQGRSRSPYFHIIKPVPGVELTVGQPVKCMNPKTQAITTGIVTPHFWTFEWEEIPVWLEVKMLEVYGISAATLRTKLIFSDPEFEKPSARLVLIRETI